jgi:hypothetical protein
MPLMAAARALSRHVGVRGVVACVCGPARERASDVCDQQTDGAGRAATTAQDRVRHEIEGRTLLRNVLLARLTGLAIAEKE